MTAPVLDPMARAALSKWFNALPNGSIGKEHFDALMALVEALVATRVARVARVAELERRGRQFTIADLEVGKNYPWYGSGFAEYRGIDRGYGQATYVFVPEGGRLNYLLPEGVEQALNMPPAARTLLSDKPNV